MLGRVDAALRPQPTRAGRDFWATPSCLIGALTVDVLPRLPGGPVWEPAAGDRRLAEAIRDTGRIVVATDLETCDFLCDNPPGSFASIVTNPPFNKLDEFLYQGLVNLDADVTQSVVFLLRWDHLTAKRRTEALCRAAEIRLCPWRPRWIANTTISPRWSFCWVTWRRDYGGPPVLQWSNRSTATPFFVGRQDHLGCRSAEIASEPTVSVPSLEALKPPPRPIRDARSNCDLARPLGHSRAAPHVRPARPVATS